MSLRPVRIIPGNGAILEERAKALAKREDRAEPAGEEITAVGFFLGSSACAVELSNVAKVVPRLGEVQPLAGAATAVRGIAFIDNLPRMVADLQALASGRPRDLAELASAPALVLRFEATVLAVSVGGPVELMEGQLSTRALGRDPLELGPMHFTGQLADGTMVVSSEWLRHWTVATASGA